jgi:MFS family permease
MAEMTIRRFGVLSVAKMYGLLMFLFGLIFGVIYGLILIVFGAAISAMGPGRDAAAGGIGTVAMGVGMMIGLPLFYGILGFIMGAIGALIYNAVSGIIGGIKFELEGVQDEYAPPPPPHQWAPNQYPAQ